MPRTLTDSEARAQPLDPSDADVGRQFGEMYRELHRVARGQRRRMWDANTLNTTALVHETYLKLVDQSSVKWHGGEHFRALAATAMRHILINYAEHKTAQKRGGQLRRTTLHELPDMTDTRTQTLIEIGEVMVTLDELEPRLAQVVDCRYFAGMTECEIAKALDITERTVRRDWVKAKSLLAELLSSAQAERPRRHCSRETYGT